MGRYNCRQWERVIVVDRHRASPRRIPEWIAAELRGQAPDAVLLSEYVEGPDHGRFVTEMALAGLSFASFSRRVEKQNQTAIFTILPQVPGTILASDLDPSITPNFLHAKVGGTNLISFRMPAFEAPFRALKRATWDLLFAALEPLKAVRTVIGGDFNTALTDPVSGCGDCLRALVKDGWIHAAPTTGHSFKHKASGSERVIDHVFASPSFLTVKSEFSWGFLGNIPEAKRGVVGYPDHAMLVADLETV